MKEASRPWAFAALAMVAYTALFFAAQGWALRDQLAVADRAERTAVHSARTVALIEERYLEVQKDTEWTRREIVAVKTLLAGRCDGRR